MNKTITKSSLLFFLFIWPTLQYNYLITKIRWTWRRNTGGWAEYCFYLRWASYRWTIEGHQSNDTRIQFLYQVSL